MNGRWPATAPPTVTGPRPSHARDVAGLAHADAASPVRDALRYRKGAAIPLVPSLSRQRAEPPPVAGGGESTVIQPPRRPATAVVGPCGPDGGNRDRRIAQGAT